MSDASWIHFFHRTKQDVAHLFRTTAVALVPENSPNRAWSYSLAAPPSHQLELLFLIYYMLSSLAIAFVVLRTFRLFSRSKPLLVTLSVLTHGWALYGDTWRDVSCALQRRNIAYPRQLQVTATTYGGVVHHGLLSTGTTIYALACVLLFRDMVLSKTAGEKMNAYLRLCIGFVGMLWFGAVEGMEDEPKCRSLLSHLMHAVLTNGLFLCIVVTASSVVVREKARRSASLQKSGSGTWKTE